MTETNTMPEGREFAAKSARYGQPPTSSGTFSIRRAQYFTNNEKQLPSGDEQRDLVNLSRAGDIDARRKLIANNMHLVTDHAKRHANRGLALLDLVREGTQGLVNALERFEPEGGFSFATYATLCISHNIERALIVRNKKTDGSGVASGDGKHNGLAA